MLILVSCVSTHVDMGRSWPILRESLKFVVFANLLLLVVIIIFSSYWYANPNPNPDPDPNRNLPSAASQCLDSKRFQLCHRIPGISNSNTLLSQLNVNTVQHTAMHWSTLFRHQLLCRIVSRCTAEVIALVKGYGLSPYLYADDTQIYGSCSPSYVDMFLSTVTDCVNAVADWMQANHLQLNSDRTEFMWYAMWYATVTIYLPSVG